MNRQAFLRAIEGLDLAFLIDAQHQGMLRRIQVEADNVNDFLGELRIVRELEGLRAMRLQAIRLPHPLHHAVRHFQMLRQRARAPMRSSMWVFSRRDAHDLRRDFGAFRRSAAARRITLDTRKARLREAIAPQAHRLHTGLQLRGDVFIELAICRRQHNLRSQNQSRRRAPAARPLL
jgi:hypothetical protein